MDPNNENTNQRAYTRTHVSLPVRYTILTQEDDQELKREHPEGAKDKEPPQETTSLGALGSEPENYATVAILKHIDRKLNYIIEHEQLSERKHYLQAQRLPSRGKAVGISATVAILKHIDSKLNYIIEQLSERKHYLQVQRLPSRGKAVDISATGLKLLCAENMAVGALLDLNFCLPLIPELCLNIRGEARWVEPLNSENSAIKYRVGVKFVEISEEKREALIRYTFQRQRQLIRNKRDHHSL